MASQLLKCNPFNLDGVHSQMEMLLAALFDGSYCHEEKTLFVENGSVEYSYTKGPIGYKMFVRLLSLEEPRERFVVRFEGKVFRVRDLKHPLLDLSPLCERMKRSSTFEEL